MRLFEPPVISCRFAILGLLSSIIPQEAHGARGNKGKMNEICRKVRMRNDIMHKNGWI
mgnify:CR=1 FL=1